jgi:hypothetical protein
MRRRSLTVLLALLALGAAAPGCGGDDEPDGAPTAPQLTVPQTETDETETGPAPGGTTTAPPADDGGGPAPPAERQQPDSPQNDVAPQPGTPESRFEKFCNENPGACG